MILKISANSSAICSWRKMLHGNTHLCIMQSLNSDRASTLFQVARGSLTTLIYFQLILQPNQWGEQTWWIYPLTAAAPGSFISAMEPINSSRHLHSAYEGFSWLEINFWPNSSSWRGSLALRCSLQVQMAWWHGVNMLCQILLSAGKRSQNFTNRNGHNMTLQILLILCVHMLWLC